jgi:hypothetical protein
MFWGASRTRVNASTAYVSPVSHEELQTSHVCRIQDRA